MLIEYDVTAASFTSLSFVEAIQKQKETGELVMAAYELGMNCALDNNATNITKFLRCHVDNMHSLGFANYSMEDACHMIKLLDKEDL